MTRYWVIAPASYDKAQKFEHFWEYDRDNSVISIGWNIGNIADLNDEERLAGYKEHFPADSKHGFHQLNKFYAVQQGDRIVARGGLKRIVGIGTALGTAYYSPAQGSAIVGDMDTDTYENFLPVQWDDLSERVFPNIVFGMQTVRELLASKFEELTSGAIKPVADLSSQVLEETGIPPRGTRPPDSDAVCPREIPRGVYRFEL